MPRTYFKPQTDSLADASSGGVVPVAPSETLVIEDEFPTASGNGEPFIGKVAEELSSRGWTPGDLFHVQLSLEEAIANAIEHGNKRDSSKLVRARAEITGDCIEIWVEDEGTGFCRCAVADPTEEENLDKPCGRGLFLIRNFMSKVWHNDKGNRIYMWKRAAGSET